MDITWVPVAVGSLVALIGVAMPFIKDGASLPSSAAILAGLVFTALPSLKSATADGAGIKIETIHEASNDINSAVAKNATAISELESLISELEASARTSRETANGEPPGPRGNPTLSSQVLENRLKAVRNSIDLSRAATSAATQKLQQMEVE